jgi:prepilin-type processing-associated H-X9-DG protein
MGINGEARQIRDVTDGTSNTVIVGERESQFHNAGIWAGTVMLTAGVARVDYLANSSRIMNVQPFRFGVRDPSYLLNGLNPEAFSSLHVGGVHFAFADGHVQFLSENIDEYMLLAFASMQQGEVIGAF